MGTFAQLMSSLLPELRLWPTWNLPAVFTTAVLVHVGLLLNYEDWVYDDLYAVRNNPLVNGKDANCGTGWGELLRCDFWGEPLDSGLSHQSWRPLTTLTYRIQWQIFGARSPRSYIAVNIIIHGVCSVLVTLLAHRLLVYANFASVEPSKKNKPVDPYSIASQHLRQEYAVCAGLIFAVHPVHIDAIATIVGRAELLWGLIFFLDFAQRELLSVALRPSPKISLQKRTSWELPTQPFCSLYCGRNCSVMQRAGCRPSIIMCCYYQLYCGMAG